MNKRELIAKVAKGARINKREALDALNSVLNSITVTLLKGNTVRLSGFGSFSVIKRVARKVLNPHTGKKITIKAKKAAKFKAGISLNKKLNK